MDNWYWFGLLVDKAGHLKLRQVHVRREDGTWIAEAWSKGESGKLWHVNPLTRSPRYDDAMNAARTFQTEFCAAYFTVDEGAPFYDHADAYTQPTGGAAPDFWADVLGVAADDDEATVKAAFRRRAMETHPDQGGDAEEFKRVYAAWEFARSEKGW